MSSSDSTDVIVDDLAQLVALDKALREAKFNVAPVDQTVAASPIIADLSRRVRSALSVRIYGTPEPPNREDMIQPTWREWSVAVQTARRLKVWPTWSPERKTEMAKDLLSPFGVSDQSLQMFVHEVDSGRA